MRRHVGFVIVGWIVTIGTAAAIVSTAEANRLQNAAAVIHAMRAQPDKRIPEEQR
jgi:hypothetical protein